MYKHPRTIVEKNLARADESDERLARAGKGAVQALRRAAASASASAKTARRMSAKAG